MISKGDQFHSMTTSLKILPVNANRSNTVVHRVNVPPPKRDPAEGAIDAKPTPVGYQESDKYFSPQVTPIMKGKG